MQRALEIVREADVAVLGQGVCFEVWADEDVSAIAQGFLAAGWGFQSTGVLCCVRIESPYIPTNSPPELAKITRDLLLKFVVGVGVTVIEVLGLAPEEIPHIELSLPFQPLSWHLSLLAGHYPCSTFRMSDDRHRIRVSPRLERLRCTKVGPG